MKRFQEIQKADVPVVGGKGANLGELWNFGIPIPEGAVITVDAYEMFMEYNNINITKEPGKIREAIMKGCIPDELKEEIITFYHQLGTQARVAVRSSATAEDLEDASFAGQQETYLNVVGEEELLEKIKACYASLWGDRAVAYRLEHGYNQTPVYLAVVLQQMVESDIAGVLFTKNPASNRDEVLINASYGLGESVVSGLVSPDEIICTRDGLIKQSHIGSKETKIIYGKKLTATVVVETSLQKQMSITKEQVKQLVAQSLQIEKHYGCPIDIEWAFWKNKLYILQARAITAGAKKEENLDDLLPPIKPMSKRKMKAQLFMMEKEPFTYYPLDYDFSMILGQQKAKIFEQAGLLVDQERKIDENGFMYAPDSKIRMTRNILQAPCLMKELKNHTHNVKKAKEQLSNIKPKIENYASKEYAKNNLEECLDDFIELRKLVTDIAYARFRYAVFPGFLMNHGLEKYLKKVDNNLSAYNLLGGLSYKTADMNRGLKTLAAEIAKDLDVKEAVLEGKQYEDLLHMSPKINHCIQDFLYQNGYKSDFNCYCFIAKSWIEDPNRFLQVLRPVLLAEQLDSNVDLTEGKRIYEALVKKTTEGISDKEKEKVLQLVEYYRFYHVFREETQYLWEMVFYSCRQVLKQTAILLHTREDELIYLFWNELQEAMKRGHISENLVRKITQREKMRPLAESYWKKQQWIAFQEKSKHLKGVSGSVGEAIGEVCIVNNPSEFHKLKKGQILVCHYTDPEWTPLFTLAAGIISDTGGALSHAAIVAREYGIPAVLATGNATMCLKDGAKVAINGTLGEVICL